jgi:hypothetical protein
MTRSAKRTPGAIPEQLKTPQPAKPRRTSAFSSADPSIRERQPVEAQLIAGRFQLVARGAGMEVVDLESERRVPFQKQATGIVQGLLAGLFGPVADADEEPRKPAGLPAELADPALGLRLERRVVRVDPRHPARVLHASARNGMEVKAYVVRLRRRAVGHILCSGPERFQVSVPELQQKITAHTSLDAAFDRVKMVTEIYRARPAPDAQDQSERPRLAGPKG